ncbi:hypothetical protein HIM_12186 [Hirsutella minnesotensis 3608]|uniref:Chromo domain-containing protein n=1 Tax=Hirsutella minnesotensis 3608 TaxID=1043627 RepID=A0A0F7ZQT5_9HYPO|nr:hypothetical protein HIM_12186 [Hirsutella minnesotensis 3608]
MTRREVRSRRPVVGELIKTAWSSQVVLVAILYTGTFSGHTFYGVVSETRDNFGLDWPRDRGLLWVFDDGHGLRLWEQPEQRPLCVRRDQPPDLEQVLGYFELQEKTYIGVKWRDYGSPTWELEDDMDDLLTDRCLHVVPIDQSRHDSQTSL